MVTNVHYDKIEFLLLLLQVSEFSAVVMPLQYKWNKQQQQKPNEFNPLFFARTTQATGW